MTSLLVTASRGVVWEGGDGRPLSVAKWAEGTPSAAKVSQLTPSPSHHSFVSEPVELTDRERMQLVAWFSSRLVVTARGRMGFRTREKELLPIARYLGRDVADGTHFDPLQVTVTWKGNGSHGLTPPGPLRVTARWGIGGKQRSCKISETGETGGSETSGETGSGSREGYRLVLDAATEVMLGARVAGVLCCLTELGFVSVRGGRVARAVPPCCNVYTATRWKPTLEYITRYAARHPSWEGDWFVSLYDGWREASRFVPPERRTYLPWHPSLHGSFVDTFEDQERFMHRHPDPTIYPLLPLKVLAYARHMGDPGAAILPDAEFLATQFAAFRASVERHDVPWERKSKDILLWRGSNNTSSASVYPSDLHPRTAAVTASSGEVTPSAGYKGLSASFEYVSVAAQLESAFLLDLDGCVHAWSGGFWKLLSGSVVVRPSLQVWEFWYSDRLVPGVTFLELPWGSGGVEDLVANAARLLDWCRENEAACVEIARRGTELANGLTMRYAVEGYEI